MTAQSLRRAIARTLAYADVFDSPLTARQVQRYLPGERATLEQVQRLLQNDSEFSRSEDWFCLRGRETVFSIRQRRAGVSARLWRAALRYGAWMAALPFVRMIAVTGSLAMDNVETGADLDYMIVARPGGVWTCRAAVLLLNRFARLEAFTLCPNYILSEQALVLTDTSHYAARELVQMVPLCGQEVYQRLRALNPWADELLPNAAGSPRPELGVKPSALTASMQQALELVLRLPLLRNFESFEMRRKIRKLREQQGQSPETHFSADVCKGHADQHGGKTLAELRRREALLAESLAAGHLADD